MRAWVLAAILAGCGGGGDPACGRADLVGGWRGYPVLGNYVDQRVLQVFMDDGSYEIFLNEAGFTGTWSFQGDGDQLTVEDLSCNASGPGTYRVEFYENVMCQEAILHIVSDGCTGRNTTLNGMHIVRM
jgi:hypothetical protein